MKSRGRWWETQNWRSKEWGDLFLRGIILCHFSCKVQRTSGGVEVTSGTTKASITYNPFQVDFFVNGEIAVVLNSRGLMNVEHYRNKR